MSLELQNNPDTFSGKPEQRSVNVFPQAIAGILAEKHIYIDPILRTKFATVQGAKASGPIEILTVDSQRQKTFDNPPMESPHAKMAFTLAEGLWCVASLVMPRRHGPESHEDDLNFNNVILFDDGTAMSITFSEAQGWSLRGCPPDTNSFGKGTRIIFPEHAYQAN